MKLPTTRPLRRLLITLLTLILFSILSFLLEPRRHSLTCRSFWSCITPHQLQYQQIQRQPIPEEQQIAVTETTLADGSIKYNRKLSTERPSLLFLVLTRDGHSWSRDFQSTRRSVYDFLDLLASTGLEPNAIALGLLTESKAEYELLRKATDQIPLGRVTVVWKNGDGEVNGANEGGDDDSNGNRDARDRWMSSTAKLRNYLMSRALLDETHVIWIDAGIVEVSKGLVQKMIAHADSGHEVGVITARCERVGAENYDAGAWSISQQGSDLLASAAASAGADQQVLVETLRKSSRMLPDLIKGTTDTDLVPLHSVGGTVLYIRADLIRQGLVFPWWKVLGTSWQGEGWFGLDTEGLCLLSRQLRGGGCYALGGMFKSRHTDWG